MRRLCALSLLVLSAMFFLSPSLLGQAVSPRTSLNEDLLFAAYRGDVAKVKTLLEKGADANAKTEEGMTALMVTASWEQHDVLLAGEEERHAAIAKLLLNQGADVNARDKSGMTALMWAAGWHHLEVTKALLTDTRIAVNAKDKQGRTALTWAARYGADHEIVKALLKKGAQIGVADVLLLGDRVKARALLAAKANSNMRGPYNETTLMMAAEQGYFDIVRVLLDKDVNVNARDKRGMTALMLAVGGRPITYIPSGHVEWQRGKTVSERPKIVKTLLDRGANPNIKSKFEDTALSIAMEVGDTASAQLLKKAGAKYSPDQH